MTVTDGSMTDGGKYALEATSSDGFSVLAGPVDLGEGILLVERFLAPNGWAPRFLPLTPVDRAINHFIAAKNPQPVEEADLFVAIRRAILCDSRNDGADCPRGTALIAHIEAHRPYRLWQGVEECLLGECIHDTEDGVCPGVEEVEPACRACSVIYDSGSEYGPEIPTGFRIDWPCEVIVQAACRYRISLDGQATADPTGTP